jgi:fibronectin-binding autotransporter adhesin
MLSFHRWAQAGVLLAAGVTLDETAMAADLHVCAKCALTSIQAAVNAAVSGDTIEIDAGHYKENVTIVGKQLTLIGQANGGVLAGPTIVDGAGRGPVFTLGSAVAGAKPELTTIEGLTITGGMHRNGTGDGGGVQVRAGAYLHLSDSVIVQNVASTGAGISVNTPNAPATTITNTLIGDNIADNGGPRGNSPGGGVAVLSGSIVSIQDSTITRNQSRNGGGLWADAGTTVTVSSSTVSTNTSVVFGTPTGPGGGNGGGILAFGHITISNSAVADNVASGVNGGGGIALLNINPNPPGTAVISNTTIARNNLSPGSEGIGGGLVIAGPVAVTLSHDFVVQNLAGGGIGIQGGDPNLQLIGTTILGNVGGDNL